MSGPWIDQDRLKVQLSEFFTQHRDALSAFGSTVNQTFEAFVFAAVIAWYRQHGWKVRFIHPGGGDSNESLRLKFSTRGRPAGYTYALCRKRRMQIQVRHQLRVETKWNSADQQTSANMFLDVAVIRPIDLLNFSTRDPVPRQFLVTFGEAKHMSAFAELIAGFIGMVHEMQPSRLKKEARSRRKRAIHLSPFLYVSGYLYSNGQGVVETIERRGYDIDVYFNTKALTDQIDLPIEQSEN